MESTRRKAYDASFKLKAIDLSIQEGNRAAARKLGVNESMVNDFSVLFDQPFYCCVTGTVCR